MIWHQSTIRHMSRTHRMNCNFTNRKGNILNSNNVYLKLIGLHRRGCYFPNERELRYFQVYSENNCLFECLTNITIELCECTAFYMPHDHPIPICGYAKMSCVDNTTNFQQHTKCKCLPACNEIFYSTQHFIVPTTSHK